MKFKNLIKYAPVLAVAALATTGYAAGTADADIMTAITAPVENAGATASAAIAVFIGASILVVAGMWGWKISRRGGGV